VSNADIFSNVIKGLHELFNSMSGIAPLLVSFQLFLTTRDLPLLLEMKDAPLAELLHLGLLLRQRPLRHRTFRAYSSTITWACWHPDLAP
jgi:hypothetical protein